MYISSFHIDDFGIFSNVTVNNLNSGLSVFFGQNEAGKSTCANFLQIMLTGFPPVDDKSLWQKIRPTNGKMAGGSINLITQKGVSREITVSRRADNYLAVSDVSGRQLSENALSEIFAGITKNVYAKIFGFSLSELEDFASLDSDDIKQILYGASFGSWLTSPQAALTQIRAMKEKLYRTDGAPTELNLALQELKQLRHKIAELRENNSAYNNLYLELENKTEQLAGLRDRKKNLEMERRKLDKKIAVWQHWRKWLEVSQQLKSMQELPDKFPEDGASRLGRLEDAQDNCERIVLAKKQKLTELRQKKDSLAPDMELVAVMPELHALAEHKSSYKHALKAKDNLFDALERQKLELERTLSRLGPDWNCDRIRSTDRSLFSKENLEKNAAEMSAANAAWHAASDNLNKINFQVESIEAEKEKLSGQITNLPAVEALLNDAERDELRQNMTRLEECTRLGPARKRALQNAQAAFNRALSFAQIKFANHDPNDEGSENFALLKTQLDHILAKQNEALTVAKETNEIRARAEAAKDALQNSAQAMELQKQKIVEAREDWRTLTGPDRAALENKIKTLRTLRAISANIENEKERLAELDKRLTIEQARKSEKNWGLIFFAILFFLAGGAIFIANKFFGYQELNFGSDLILPLNLWAAYVALACGVILLAVGLPGNRQEEKKRKQEYLQLQNRRETSSMHLAELGSQAQRLCQEAEIDNMDPITLDATEMLIEREKEQCFQEERSRQDIDGLEADLNALQLKHTELTNQATELDAEVQKARKRWHGLMQEINAGIVPLPEAAEIFFTRVESARMAYDNVENAQKELDALWEDLHLIEQNIITMPIVAKKLQEAEQPGSLEETTRQILAECKDADVIQERRALLEMELNNCQTRLEQMQAEQTEASLNLQKMESQFSLAQKNWNDSVSSLGLGDGLTPETVKEAYRLMEECLSLEEQIDKLEHDAAENKAAIDAIRAPLQKMHERLNILPDYEETTQPDWVLILDKLLARAEEAKNILGEKQSLQTAIEDAESELSAEEAALTSAQAKFKALLNQANAADAEEFLHLDRLYKEKIKLNEEKNKLESILAIAARDEPLEQFLSSFKEDDQETQEEKLQDLDAQINLLTDETLEQSKIIGELKTESQKLACNKELTILRQDEEMLKEKINRQIEQWAAYAFAEGILTQAKNTFEKEKQPEIIQKASIIFTKITAGHWKGLGLSLDDSQIMAVPAHGEAVSTELLSRGVKEQAYLALRLAYNHEHGKKAESLPIIMDEVFVNFDQERIQRSIRTIAEFVANKEQPQQIIYFTCQQAIVDLLKQNVPDASLFLVQNRQIQML